MSKQDANETDWFDARSQSFRAGSSLRWRRLFSLGDGHEGKKSKGNTWIWAERLVPGSRTGRRFLAEISGSP